MQGPKVPAWFPVAGTSYLANSLGSFQTPRSGLLRSGDKAIRQEPSTGDGSRLVTARISKMDLAQTSVRITGRMLTDRSQGEFLLTGRTARTDNIVGG